MMAYVIRPAGAAPTCARHGVDRRLAWPAEIERDGAGAAAPRAQCVWRWSRVSAVLLSYLIRRAGQSWRQPAGPPATACSRLAGRGARSQSRRRRGRGRPASLAGRGPPLRARMCGGGPGWVEDISAAEQAPSEQPLHARAGAAASPDQEQEQGAMRSDHGCGDRARCGLHYTRRRGAWRKWNRGRRTPRPAARAVPAGTHRHVASELGGTPRVAAAR